ncbi:hypothetical protein [Nocardia arthritidis]|uniref:Uncharacterized protein n=1 Tax=Nocardia arthritidis TaxID=228602 RepID=A0A6G9Y9Y3_9NOCA|nr:hypothetical protein [Nocardia arthritidis]QIS09853.1 hypothetical protein F5544_09765 [Nocardia arthritidis]
MDHSVSQIHDLECPQQCGKPQRHLGACRSAETITEVDRLVNGHDSAIGANPGAGSILRGMWNMQSGVAHGGLWSMEFAAIAPHGSDRERLRISADVGMVAAQLKMVTVITYFACRLYCLRSGNAESEDMSHVGGSSR